MSRPTFTAAPLLLALVACHDDASTCSLSGSLGTVTAVIPDAHYANAYGQDPATYYMTAPLDETAAPDTLVIELRGSFSEMVVFDLGANADYESCAACVLVYPNWNAERGPNGNPFVARGGTLTFTTLSPDFVAGTLRDVSFFRADFGLNDDTKLDTCNATLSRLAFAAVPEVEPD